VGCGKHAVALREADPGTAKKRQQCMATLPPAGEASLRRIRLLTLQICGKCIGGAVSRWSSTRRIFGQRDKLVLRIIQMVHGATQLVMPGLDQDKPGHDDNVNHVFVSKH
jgi:hypothetical protein